MKKVITKKEINFLIKLLFVGLCILITFCAVGCFSSEPKYYLGETLSYEDVDVIIDKVYCEKVKDKDSQYDGLFELTICFSLKNNKTKQFEFEYNDFYVKTEDKGEEYKEGDICETLNGIISDYFEGEKLIIPGQKRTFEIHYYVPYSLEEKNFILNIDWGFFSEEKEYYLYSREN